MPTFKEFSDDEPRTASEIAATGCDTARFWQDACKHLVGALERHEQVLDDLLERVAALESR